MFRACGIALFALMVALFAVPPHLMADSFTFTTIDFPASTGNIATGINNSGEVVGGYGSGVATHGFLLSGGTFTSIDFPGPTTTLATGINDSGEVVGGYSLGFVNHGFLATPTIPEPGTLASTVGAIGVIAVWSLRRRRHSSGQ